MYFVVIIVVVVVAAADLVLKFKHLYGPGRSIFSPMAYLISFRNAMFNV